MPVIIHLKARIIIITVMNGTNIDQACRVQEAPVHVHVRDLGPDHHHHHQTLARTIVINTTMPTAPPAAAAAVLPIITVAMPRREKYRQAAEMV